MEIIKSVDLINKMNLDQKKAQTDIKSNDENTNKDFSSMLKREQELLKLKKIRKEIKEVDIQDIAKMMKRR